MIEMDELPPQDQPVPFPSSASEKLLVRAVYIMGILLMVLFLVLIGAIIWKSTRKNDVPANFTPAAVQLGLPAGTSVQSMQLDGDRLAISTGAEIIIVDIRKNIVISRITINTK